MMKERHVKRNQTVVIVVIIYDGNVRCVCGGKDQPASQILCDDCDQAFHIWCLSPPLKQVPEEDEWLVVYSRERERER